MIRSVCWALWPFVMLAYFAIALTCIFILDSVPDLVADMTLLAYLALSALIILDKVGDLHTTNLKQRRLNFGRQATVTWNHKNKKMVSDFNCIGDGTDHVLMFWQTMDKLYFNDRRQEYYEVWVRVA